jgi:putative peptidoglycan lipid II flippase
LNAEDTRRPGASRIPFIAALLAGSVLLSRALGLVREMVLGYQLGAGPEVDAYRAAFLIPDILFHFLSGGAFAVAFVPFYTRIRETRGDAAAERLLATTFGTMAVIAVLASAGLWLAAEPLVALQFPRFAPETQALTVRLTRIVLPAQFFFVTGGVLRAALMASDRFATQALAPLVYNVGIIAGGVAGGAALGAEGFAWGALAGAVVGPFLLPLLDLRRARLRLGFRVAPFDRDFLAYLWRAAPLIMGLSLLTVDEWYDKWFGGLLAAGSVAQIGYARMLMLLPVGVIGQAVATAALPALSQLASQGRREELDRTLLAILRASLSLAVVLAAGVFALTDPIVALLFERGRFTAEHGVGVAGILAVFCFGIPGWVVQQVAGRGFYAREDMWRPMFLSTGVALVAIPLYRGLGAQLGAEGIAAAGAIAMTVSALVLLLALRGLHGGPPLAPFFGSLPRALAVAVPCALAAAWAGALAQAPLARVALGGLAFTSVAIPGLWWAGDEATREILGHLGQKLGVRLPGRSGS